MNQYQLMVSELGYFIKRRLKEMKRTQSWLAEEMLVSDNAVSKWVKTGSISRENFFVLVGILGPQGAPFLDSYVEGEPSRLNGEGKLMRKAENVVNLSDAKPDLASRIREATKDFDEEKLKQVLEYVNFVASRTESESKAKSVK